MTPLPVIIGFGGIGAAGRSSGFHAYRRTVLDSLPASFRKIREIIIDARDQYMAQKVRDLTLHAEHKPKRALVVIGAGHLRGLEEALQNEHSLIFTAAASDKASFGCANENEYTYFGEALFKNMDDKPYQFVEHFVQAMEKVRQRELHENLIPSEPQLFIGKLMKEKLKLLERDIAKAAISQDQLN